MDEITFKDEQEHVRDVEATNFLIGLLNRERKTSIGTYIDLNYPDGTKRKVFCEFVVHI